MACVRNWGICAGSAGFRPVGVGIAEFEGLPVGICLTGEKGQADRGEVYGCLAGTAEVASAGGERHGH